MRSDDTFFDVSQISLTNDTVRIATREHGTLNHMKGVFSSCSINGLIEEDG